ncbi:HAMP domain-containing sensor histidine kinase [Bdellovibrio sp. KM01]|uniref:sensor histidine kinase n=1 Tax=Bdellovibrio sp. KM01 TaxID=2748865 RepID=UPI0015EA802D|nr:HAMP domain-containing sensor histidine kinase [Bdellovibrio sp. KM01]QLY24704.1 GHKL domain-containing protein [Bdellovibrio sp. KM01]
MLLHLRSKIIALVLFAVLLSVAGTVFFTTMNFLEDKRNYITDVNSVASAHAAKLLSQILQNYRKEFEHLNDLLPRGDRAITERLDQIQGLEQIRIYDLRGSLLLSAGRASKTDDVSWIEKDVEVFKVKQKSLFKTPSDKSFLFVSQIDDHIYAATFANGSLLSGFNLASALNASLMNSDGEVLVENKETPVWADSAIKSFAAEFFTTHRNQQVWAQILSLQQGPRVLVAMSPLEGLNQVGVMVAVPDAESAHLASQITRNSLPFVVGILIVVGVLALLFSLRLTRSLEALTKATSLISGGNWDVQFSYRSRDEVGQLGKAFRKMGKELKVREEDLRKAHNNLLRSEKLASLGQFSAGVAHEIKNPLTSILTYAQLIERKLGVEKENPNSPGQFAKYIVEETLRANRIVTELLTFARQKAPTLTSQNVIALTENTLALLSPQLETAGVKLHRNYDAQSTINAAVDADQIRQVMSNLVMNASQAMEEQPADRKNITVSLTQEGSELVIKVADTGPGISPENLGKIFEPFFSTKATGKGTGLGLSMVHGIIQQHHGQISVNSNLGEGAEFEIRLPLA